MQTKRTKLFSVLLTLAMLLSLLPAGTIPVTAAEGTAYYVSSSGSDANDGTSEDKPFLTLAKAVDVAEDGSTIYVMTDLTMTQCARFYDKSLTITSLGDTRRTIFRGDDFATQQDAARSWYNPAMIEVQTTSAGAGLTLTNIILHDSFEHEGKVFAQAISGEGNENNTDYVQDAMIASNATYPTTITLGDGAELQSFGGMSAVRVTGKAKLVMKSGSVITDTAAVQHTKGTAAGEVGPAGAVWVQGASFEMEAGAEIKDLDGRAVYVDGGSATIGGTISDIKANANMWQGRNGVAIHLRNKATGTLLQGGVIEWIQNDSKDAYMVCVNGKDSSFEMKNGSYMKNGSALAINAENEATVTVNGTIADNNGKDGPFLRFVASSSFTLGASGIVQKNTTNNIGLIYIQSGSNAHLYGKIKENTAPAGAVYVVTNGGSSHVYMYNGAEITGNTSSGKYGVIEVQQGECSFTMNGGLISGNKAKAGAVQIRKDSAKFVMNAGSIVDNELLTSGTGDAGVYLTGSADITAELNGGTLQSIAVDKDVIGKSARGHVYIADDFVLQSGHVTMRQDSKTIAPADDSFDIKLGNAHSNANTALTTASTDKSWGAPLATFWAQRDGVTTLTVGGMTLTDDLPVYVLTHSVTGAGLPDRTNAKCYAAARTTDGVKFTIPAADLSGTGCAIAVVQPTADYGTLTISGPESITEDKTAESYPVDYTVTYTISENLANIIKESGKTASYRLALSPDAKLTGTTYIGSFDGITFTANYTLPKDAFEANKSLFTSAVMTMTVDGTNYVIPSNMAETKMLPLAQHTVNFDLNGGSGSIAPVTVNHGDALGDQMPANPSRSGYRFLGWNTQRNGSGDSFTKDTAVNADVTLYAQWARRPEAPSSSGSVSDLNSADHIAYVHGYDDGTVRPNANITRAATAAMLYRLLTPERRAEIYSTSNSFSDVTAADWCNEAVSTMTRGGYIGGFKDGTFGGSRSITRAQFVAILVRFVGVDDSTCSFTDVPTSHWAYEYIATATANNWIGGYKDGSFKPDQLITRAQAMAIINRVLNRGVDENSELLNCRIWPDISEEDWYYYEVIEATNGHEYTGSRPSENWTKLLND